MAQLLLELVKTARPRQWLKNTAIFAPLVFSGFLFEPGYLSRVIFAFILFCLLSSGLYIFNDIVDAPSDRLHPFKKKRPIASNRLPLPEALFVGLTAITLALSLAWTTTFFFFLLALLYTLIQISYTLWIKHLSILDVLTIATGFVLRVYAGSVVVNLHMNVWFLLTVISAALFLAVGKRQSERTLLNGIGERNLSEHRATLGHYSQRLLDIYTGMFANTTWLTYALFAFQQQFIKTEGPLPTLFATLPLAFTAQKWLMATVPVVIYGVMRYLQLVYEQNQGESPERVLLSDRPLLTAVILWSLMVLAIIYAF